MGAPAVTSSPVNPDSGSAVRPICCGCICIAPGIGPRFARNCANANWRIRHSPSPPSLGGHYDLEETNLGEGRMESISRCDDDGEGLDLIDLPRLLTDQLCWRQCQCPA